MKRTGALAFVLLMAFSAAHAEDPNPASLHSERGAWPLYRQWNPAEVGHFSKWINHIYRTKCNGTREQWLAKLEGVLTDPEMNLLLQEGFAGSPANPQLDIATIRAMHSIIDCGKLTVALGAYYAYRRGLPWMQCYVRCGDGSGDLRTAAYTIPSGCINSFEYDSTHAFFVDAITGMCTGNFRVELNRRNSEISDTLPVAIDQRYLRPGCLFYLDGHVLIVGDIDAFGEVFFVDATVSPTRDIYIHNGFNAVTGIAARNGGANSYSGCFRGFRIQRFPIAEVNGDGKVTSVRRRTDDEMREFGYSTDQYDALQKLTTEHAIPVALDDRELAVDNFHDYVRLRLRTAKQIDPAADIERFARDFLELVQEREKKVQQAWRDVQENGLIEFPETKGYTNIYNAGGRWGEHTTAISDLVMRMRYCGLETRLMTAVTQFDLAPDWVVVDRLNKHAIWTRNDLICAIGREKTRQFGQVRFEYTNSAGDAVSLSLADVERRLFDLSFDPNQPPELRWGAAPGSDEAKTAPDAPTLLPGGQKMAMAESYQRQAFYRCLIERNVEPTPLRGMFVDGFAKRDKIETHLSHAARGVRSPVLVPHNGLLEWLKANPAGAPGVTPALTRVKKAQEGYAQ